MADNTYTKDSIESLTPLEHVRLRPGMYAGDTSDATQLAIEILGNAIDEYNIGHGTEIIVNLNDNGVVQIEDHGQGFPINSLREDGETVLQAAFDVMNTSGKYREDGVYEGTAIGLNGIGGKLTNFLSNWLEVISHDSSGKYEHIWFEEGVFKNREIGEGFDWTGTTVTFKPSDEFFTNPKVDEQKLKNFCEDITCLCKDLKIVFNNKVIKHDNGIDDLLTKHIGKDIEIVSNRLRVNEVIGKQKLNLAMTYTSKSSSSFVAYVNCGLTTAGPHITGVKSTITRVLNNWARENGILKENDKNLDGNSLQEGLVLACNITAEGVAYDAQVKSTITKIDTGFINNVFAKSLEIWLDTNPADATGIIENALVARKAAEAAKKARQRVKENANKKTKFAAMPSKLADCNCKDRTLAELYVTEGDSASGGAKMIRDASTQAVMGLRGKPLNCITAKSKAILKNAEVVDILKALGFDYEIDKQDNLTVKYDKKKLRYGKFIIAADKDSDGSHIQTLVLAMLWKLVPDMIIDGYVYIAEPPLYKAEWGTQYKYLADKNELEEFKKNHKGGFTLTYFKG